MRFDDKIFLKLITESEDEEGYVVETEEWLDLGKCIIFPNSQAIREVSEDMQQRVYSYTVVMRKPKLHIPKEGDWINLKSKDGAIDSELQVKGIDILGGRYLKIWV